MIVILMGVSGSGKTTIGHALSAATGCPFADADDFHSPENKQKMREGHPLTDADRGPWLQRLNEQILAWAQAGADAILACSALRRSYRDALVRGAPEGVVRFVYLTAPEAVLRARMEARHGHYMPAALLPSQLATLEPPEHALQVSVVPPVPDVVAEIRNELPMACSRDNGNRESLGE
jgi:gluconokinase